jgi:hypothetical protein
VTAPLSVWAAWTMAFTGYVYLASVNLDLAMFLGFAGATIRLFVYYVPDDF